MDLATATSYRDAAVAQLPNAGKRITTSDGKSISYPPVDDIMNEINYWQNIVNQLTASAAGATGDLTVRTPKWS